MTWFNALIATVLHMINTPFFLLPCYWFERKFYHVLIVAAFYHVFVFLSVYLLFISLLVCVCLLVSVSVCLCGRQSASTTRSRSRPTHRRWRWTMLIHSRARTLRGSGKVCVKIDVSTYITSRQSWIPSVLTWDLCFTLHAYITSHVYMTLLSGCQSAVVLTLNYVRSCTEYTLADARRISKTSSVRPAAQQHVLACDRLPAASTWRHGCEPSLENAPSRMPDRLHGTHCHLTFVLQPALPCSRNYSKHTF